MRLASVEQGREQAAEVSVDLFECVKQPDAALAVEAADRSSQSEDRLGQLLLLSDIGLPAGVQLGHLRLGDEVDRANPLALGCQPVERLLFDLGIAEIG